MDEGFSEKVDEKTVFYLPVSGREISSLQELKELLKQMDEDEFSHHVSEDKNDFEDWVRNTLKERELADLLRKKKDKEGMVQVVDYFLTKEELNNPTSDFYEEEIPEVKWVKTDIPGFDNLIHNGIPEGNSILLAGGPGTGKTTFCLQLINNLALKNKNCLYLTFEEEAASLKRHMKNYGFDPIKLEKEGKMVIKKMQPFDLSRSVEALLAKASGELTIELDEVEGIIPKGFKPKIIILDSLSAVAAAFTGREEGYRIYIEQLFSLFRNIGATSFLITETEQETHRYSKSGVEEFLADGVVVFYNIRNKNIRSNAIEILKLRGTSHEKKVVPFKIIANQGIVVYPMEESFS
ncbi:MAG: AAA family ATPase [Firmicutes bacterium]|nr:AAA family ATPase [Bacillota bacterium]